MAQQRDCNSGVFARAVVSRVGDCAAVVVWHWGDGQQGEVDQVLRRASDPASGASGIK